MECSFCFVCLKEKNKDGIRLGNDVGRKRKPEEEIMKTISINLQQKVLTEIEKEGKPKKIIEELVTSKYLK